MATRLQDVQAAITRADEVAKLQQTQHNAPQAQQEQITAQIQQEKELKRHQTQETTQKEGAKIRDEGNMSRRRRYVSSSRKQKKNAQTKNQETVKTTGTGNRIDLKA